MPPVKMKGDGRKARDPKKTLTRLLGYMRKYIQRGGLRGNFRQFLKFLHFFY